MSPTEDEAEAVPPGYSYPATAAWFLAGAIVTAAFSGSLAALTAHARPAEVLSVGMIVPCFTWAVQLGASWIVLPTRARRLYWGDLGRICLLGSVALLPAAVANLSMPHAPLWPSALNVLACVAAMGSALFRLAARHGISIAWPVSWCVTITVNMLLFVWSSRGWW